MATSTGEELIVDRDAGIIYGYSVIQTGEALGHDMLIDEVTLEQVLNLGQAAGSKGIKSRFAHPPLFGDAIGKFLGRSKNFRRDGERIRADLHLSPTAFNTPHGDLATYVLDLAESDPNAFGASIVSRGQREQQRDKYGDVKRGKDGKPLLPFYRVESLKAVDIVDDPAANRDGLASDGLPEVAVRQITSYLDALTASGASEAVVRQRVNEFVEDYIEMRAA